MEGAKKYPPPVGITQSRLPCSVKSAVLARIRQDRCAHSAGGVASEREDLASAANNLEDIYGVKPILILYNEINDCLSSAYGLS